MTTVKHFWGAKVDRRLFAVLVVAAVMALSGMPKQSMAVDPPPPPTLPQINVSTTQHPCSYYGEVAVDDGAACVPLSNILPPVGGPSAGPGTGGVGAGAGKPFTPVNTLTTSHKSADRSPTPCPQDKNNTGGDMAGDPIEISTQSKVDSITLFSQPSEGGLSYSLSYTSPSGWYDNLGFRLVLNCGNPMPDTGPTCGHITYYRGDGSAISFTGQAGTTGNFPENDGGNLATLVGNADGTYTLHDEDGSTKTFNASGFIMSIVNSQGIAWNITGSNIGGLETVTSSNGTSFTISRQVTTVNGVTIHNATVTDPAGNIYTYSYTVMHPKLFLLNPMQISSLTLPGSPATTITWKYTAGYQGWYNLLTETDYNGIPYSKTTYDTSTPFNRATGESLADGTGAIQLSTRFLVAP